MTLRCHISSIIFVRFRVSDMGRLVKERRGGTEIVLPLSNWSSPLTKAKFFFLLIMLACGLELVLGPLPCNRLHSLPKADVFCPCAGSFVLHSAVVLA